MRRRVRLVSILVCVLFVGGCASLPSVGPDYQEPEIEMPSHWLTEEKALSSKEAETVSLDWWKLFDDKALGELVGRAIESSPDIRIALARVGEARAALQVATAGFYPQIDAGASFDRTNPSDSSLQSVSRSLSPFNQYSTGFDASWEIDVFGGLRREREAAVATLEASDATYADVMISLLAEVARNYFSIRAFDKRLLVSKRNVETQSESLELVTARFDAGLVSELDVAQATSLLETTRAEIPRLEDERVNTLTALSILLGDFPDATEEFFASHPKRSINDHVAKLPAQVSVGIPLDLLRRRPDVRVLERELAAQTARVGVAVSDQYPRFSITGQFGYSSFESGSVFERDSERWVIGPSIQLPLFRGGSIQGNIEAQDQRMLQALARYEKGVLTAVAETESALSSFARQKERQVFLGSASRASERALVLSRDLYTQGIADFQRVLDAERASLIAENALVVAEESTVLALISIYKALGGGWDPELGNFEDAWSNPDQVDLSKASVEVQKAPASSQN